MVAGLGPGHPDHLTGAARSALEQARVVVGYKGYIKLLDPALLADKEIISTGMTGEVDRAGQAVDAALAGQDTVVVSSGDPGVYAMAGLVLELLEARGALQAVDLQVLPGVPALCAAAALLGAPLMHDFASISLSDLLTPWERIEQRIRAAAGADFVLVLYNPRSKRRAGHLARALDLILEHRGEQTPVGVVARAMRPGQSVQVTTLAGVRPEEVDMQTVLIVGNSTTRIAAGRMLTPRGYHGKYDLTS